MDIRKALPGEEEKALAFYHELIDGMRDNEYRPAWTKGVYPAREDIDDAVRRGQLFLARVEAKIVGAFILNHVQGEGYDRVPWRTEAPGERAAVLHLLGVHPAVQGRGVGTEVLRKAAELSREAGDEVIRLDTLPWNRPGRRMYECFGFQYCGEIRLTYPSTGTIPFSMYEYAL